MTDAANTYLDESQANALVDRTEAVVGYRFGDVDLLCEALTHASCAVEQHRSNERMEFLGDAILGTVVCEYLFEAYPDLQEGELTKIKSTVVSRKSCASASRAMGLCDLLSLGKGMSGRSGVPASVSAAVFESMVAAIDLDGGRDASRAFILDHMVPIIQRAASSAHQQNFKSVLQQHAQRHLTSNPQYRLLDEKGPDHAKCFEVCVEMDGQQYSSAWANSKKEAEQKAALIALSEMGLAEIDEQGHVHLVGDALD